MAPGGSTRGNSQEELGQGDTEQAKPIVACASPDKQHHEQSGVKFIEALEDEDEDGSANVDANGEKIEPGKSNLENFKYYTSLFLGTLCLVMFNKPIHTAKR